MGAMPGATGGTMSERRGRMDPAHLIPQAR